MHLSIVRYVSQQNSHFQQPTIHARIVQTRVLPINYTRRLHFCFGVVICHLFVTNTENIGKGMTQIQKKQKNVNTITQSRTKPYRYLMGCTVRCVVIFLSIMIWCASEPGNHYFILHHIIDSRLIGLKVSIFLSLATNTAKTWCSNINIQFANPVKNCWVLPGRSICYISRIIQ